MIEWKAQILTKSIWLHDIHQAQGHSFNLNIPSTQKHVNRHIIEKY